MPSSALSSASPSPHPLPYSGVISFIAILVVVVIVLVSVVSLRFKCRKNKESEGTCPDPQGPLCLSLMRDPELDSGTDTQPGVEGRNGTTRGNGRVHWVGFEGQLWLLSYSL